MRRDFDRYSGNLEKHSGKDGITHIGLAVLIYLGTLGCGGTASLGSSDQTSGSSSIQVVDSQFEAGCNEEQGYRKAVDENIPIDLTGDGTVDMTRSTKTCRKDGAPDNPRQCPTNYNMVEKRTLFESTDGQLPQEQVEYICVYPGSEPNQSSGK